MNEFDYEKHLSSVLQSPAFAGLTLEEKQDELEKQRLSFIENNPEVNVDLVNKITNDNNVNYLRNTGEGRVVPNLEKLGVIFPNQKPGWDDLSRSERQEKIDEFKTTIDGFADKNPTQRDDTKFYLEQSARYLERVNNGEDKGRFRDRASRVVEGALAGFLTQVNATDAAESVRDFFHENPQYDEEFTSKLASGLGDLSASMAIFVGTALTTRGLGGGALTATRTATGASLAGNAIMRYNTTYQEAIEAGIDPEKAHDAGVAAMPAAAIDVLGDRIIGSKLLPDNINTVFSTGTLPEKKKLLADLIKDNTSKAKLFEVGRTGFMEGITEVAGDYYAGHQAYMTTGSKDFVPDGNEMFESFAIGALLGSGIAGATEAPSVITGNQRLNQLQQTDINIDKVKPDQQKQIWDLLSNGQYAEAYKVSNSLLNSKQQADSQFADIQETTDIDSESIDQIQTHEGNLPFSRPAELVDLYRDLTDSIFEGNNNIDYNQQSIERDARINESAPERARVISEIDSVIENTEITKDQSRQAKGFIDTIGAKWMAETGGALNDFYQKFNFSEVENIRKLANIVDKFVSKVPDQTNKKRQVGSVAATGGSVILTPRANLNSLMQGLISEFNRTGILADVLSEQEMSQINESIGSDVDFETELSNRFSGWLADPNSSPDLSSGFNKLKNWIKDIYNGFRNFIKPENRNTDLDSVFESLFQVTLSPSEFEVRQSRERSSNTEQQINQSQDAALTEKSSVLIEAESKLDEAKSIAREVFDVPFSAPFDADPEITKANQFLESFKSGLNDREKGIVDRMISDLSSKNPDADIEVVDNLDAEGLYDPITNKITIGSGSLNLRVLGHEVTHALTAADINKYIQTEGDYENNINTALEDNQTPEYLKNLIRVYKHAAKTQGKKIGGPTDFKSLSQYNSEDYPFVSLHEFVAGAMSSQSFQETLSQIPYKGRTLWDHVIDAFKAAYDWITGIGADPALVLRANGENALAATLLATKRIIESDVNQGQGSGVLASPLNKDSEFESAFINNNIDIANQLVKEAAEAAGFDSSKVYYRGDKEIWSIADRPTYLTSDTRLAEEFASSRNGFDPLEVRKFYIKKDLKFAKVGDRAGWNIIQTSSYLNQFGNQILPSKYYNQGGYFNGVTSTELSVSGYDGMQGIMDGTIDSDEVVIINPYNVKLAEPFTFDINGKLVPLSKRFSQTSKNINYSPKQKSSFNKARSFKRLAAIQKGKLNDKFDSKTMSIIRLVQGINPSDLNYLDTEAQSYFFSLVDNIYEARKNAVSNPQVRIDSPIMIQQIEAVRNLLDKGAIADMISKYDNVIDFDESGIDLNDRDAVTQLINEYNEKAEIESQTVGDNSAKNTRQEKINQKYREEYANVVEQISDRYGDAENFVEEIESSYGQSLSRNPMLKDFVIAHYNYITNINTENLKGKELYQHFYAANNILDGNFIGLRLTAKHIADMRNKEQQVAVFKNTFRDAVVDKYKLLKGLDQLNQMAELHQVQAMRYSAFDSSKKFIQEDLLGPLYESIIIHAENRKKSLTDKWKNDVQSFEEKVGRPMNEEDRIMISIFGRLQQFALNENPDVALKRNIKKELESLENSMSYQSGQANYIKEKIKPLFDNAINGLETMDQLFREYDQRIKGTETDEVAQARSALVESMSDLFSNFDLESRIISEGFHNKPFVQFAYYVPNPVQSAEADPNMGNIEDPIENISDNTRLPGMKSKQSHYYERMPSLGKKKFYSYNPEHIIDRKTEILSVDSATISERFILSERLKDGSELANIININNDGTENKGRSLDILSLAKKLVVDATSRGEPAGILLSSMRAAVNMYARPVLSGIHHVVTQPLAALSDYAIRTGNISGWFDAARFYAANSDKVNSFFERNARWVSDRGALEAMSLDVRKNVEGIDKSLKNNPVIKKLDSIYDKASALITISLRTGDKFSSKITTMAEYVRLLKEKGYDIQSMEDVDLDVAEGRILTEAILNTERNINTSNKILRGELFSDRRNTMSMVRNLLFAFSAHTTSLSTQMNMAFRDIVELKMLGAPNSEIESKMRTIAAIATQSFMFTSARFVIGAMSASIMISMIRDMFDDEEGVIEEAEEKLRIAREEKNKVKIAQAEQELAIRKNVRSVVNKFGQTSQSPGSWFKQVARDEMGSFWIGFANGTINKIIFTDVTQIDPYFQSVHKEAREEQIKEYRRRINEAKERKEYRKAAKLSEELVDYQSIEYIPVAYPNYGGIDIGGAYGSALAGIGRNISELGKGAIGLQEVNYTDVITAATSIGLGQAEITRFLNQVDKIEDQQWKSNKLFEEKKLPEAIKAEQERKEKENKRLIQSLYR